MNEQLEFFETVRSPPATNSLFLAFVPGRDTAQDLTEFAVGFCDQICGSSNLLRPDHLHLSLHWINDYAEVPESLVQDIGRACEAVVSRVRAFEIRFDHVMSLGKPTDTRPIALVRKDGDNVALRMFHQALIEELTKYRCLGKGRVSSFNPHLTLLYSRESVTKDLAIPFTWAVGEMVLILSEVGKTRYHRLGQWTLKA